MMTAWNSSYLFGYDNETGWGYRFYYTVYSETGPRDIFALILEIGLHILVFVITILVNVLVIVTVFRFSEIRTVTNSLLLNVVAADIVFASTMPAVMISRISNQWILEEIACKGFPYQQSVSAAALLWTLALISVDRRMSTVTPYRTRITVRQAHLLSATVWFILAIVLLPIPLFFRLQDAVDIHTFQIMFDLQGELEIMKNSSIYVEPQDILPSHYEIMSKSGEVKKICTLVFPKSEILEYAQLALMAVLLICVAPMVVLSYNYQTIFRKLMQSKDTWGSACVPANLAANGRGRDLGPLPIIGTAVSTGRRQSEISLSDILAPWPRKQSNGSQLGGGAAGSSIAGRHGSMSKQEEVRAGKHLKTARTLFINVIVVLAMWLPILIILILVHFDGQRATTDHGFFLRAHHFTAALMVCNLNTIITPLLFCLFSEDFLNSIKRLFRNTIFDMKRNVKRNGTGGQTGAAGSDHELNASSAGINRIRRMERYDVLRDKVVPAANAVRTPRNGTRLSSNRVVIDIHPSRLHSSISE